ncbi:hypothetical protein JVT61DRAFT_12428 [Boletus reticuloceps]|uniref:Uncharacterized protein n=1 Tax=Boletus reticuloceps TaxID=495285 RepID=A0A8I3A4A4_9AGAM|nr:hypothetical protein JVT61DRAFT_12428 [Boletus reticuloceps]
MTQARSNEYWEIAIKDKFSRIKSKLLSAKPHVFDDTSMETEEEVVERLIKGKEERSRKGRRDERRLNKYRRRLGITQTLAELKAERGDDDASVWKFLFDLVSALGSDGMSSDESGDKDMETVFHTHVMPWRRDLKKDLNIIDVQRLQEKNIFSTKGAKVTRRIRSGTPLARGPIVGLPQSLYDPEWLAGNLGAPSGETFRWMHIIVQH